MEEDKFKILERIGDVDMISCVPEGNVLKCQMFSKKDNKHELTKEDLEVERLSIAGDIHMSQERQGMVTALPSKDNNLKCLVYPDELQCYEEPEDQLSQETIKRVTGEQLRKLPLERK